MNIIIKGSEIAGKAKMEIILEAVLRADFVRRSIAGIGGKFTVDTSTGRLLIMPVEERDC